MVSELHRGSVIDNLATRGNKYITCCHEVGINSFGFSDCRGAVILKGEYFANGPLLLGQADDRNGNTRIIAGKVGPFKRLVGKGDRDFVREDDRPKR